MTYEQYFLILFFQRPRVQDLNETTFAVILIFSK